MTKLNQEQLNLLIDARDCTEPVVVDQSNVDALRDVLHAALERRGFRGDPSSLSIEALAGQFRDFSDEDIDSLSNQIPETGGNPDAAARGGAPVTETGAVDVESLGARQAREAYSEMKKIKALEDRTPEHCEKLKRELAADLGCEVENLPSKRELQDVVGQ